MKDAISVFIVKFLLITTLIYQLCLSFLNHRTAHLYIGQTYKHLRKLINISENITDHQTAISEFQLVGHERWLIFANQASRRQRSALVDVLKSLSIRFDSCIFAFYKEDGGNI